MNNPPPRPLFVKKDFALVVVILIAAAVIYIFHWAFFQHSGEARAQIIHRGEVAMDVSLSADGIFSLDSLPNVIFQINNGRIAFISSDCPDQICVHRGFLSRAGQSAACLPNNVVLIISSASGDDIDIVAH